MSQPKTLYLVDASIYVFRAYFSLPESITDPEGNPVNAVYGFSTFLHQLLTQTRGSHYAVAFDASLTSSFRNKIYPHYKANREPAPDELKLQFTHCQTMTRALGLATFSSKRYEADDLLGTVAKQLRQEGFKMVIVTGDKDLSQLLDAGDTFWDYSRQRKLTSKTAADHFGVKPSQMVDLLALMGDSIDNIPGVPGIGQKTAVTLLSRFRNLDNIYRNLDKIPQLPLRGSQRVANLLTEHKDSAYLSKRLATIVDTVPLRCSSHRLKKQPVNTRRVNNLCNKLGFGEGLRQRLLALT
ncbi:MAG: hypothetical protein OEY67_04730 [Gammaproteobacteria bacterium]|nr:hypothetical protein [Gammaproteobacteria bacterium]